MYSLSIVCILLLEYQLHEGENLFSSSHITTNINRAWPQLNILQILKNELQQYLMDTGRNSLTKLGNVCLLVLCVPVSVFCGFGT